MSLSSFRRVLPSSSGFVQRRWHNSWPSNFVTSHDERPKTGELEFTTMPRDGFGVPAHIPPEVGARVRHTYFVPPQYYPYFKKLGDDTPALKPYMDRLIAGDLTLDEYEEMFYKFAKPLKIDRKEVPMPYRTEEEISKSEEVLWEGKWHSFRARAMGIYSTNFHARELWMSMIVGAAISYWWVLVHRQYRLDMKLFYLEAPENKINWVVPRGDL